MLRARVFGGLAAIFVLFAASVGVAQDVTVSSNQTWNADRTVSALTINSGVTLTLGSNAKVTASSLNMGSSSHVQFATAGSRLTVNGPATMGTSSRITGSRVTLRNGAWNMLGGAHIDGNIDMSVASLTTASSAYFQATGYGFGQNQGAGKGTSNGRAYTSGSGASHGGSGLSGYQTGTVQPYYGSALEPTTPGSGGGSSWCASAGAGGGTIRLQVSGTFTHEGYIRSDGAAGRNSGCHGWRGSGGGAGGSIWVTTQTLRGANGRFYAYGGRGGGGHASYMGGGGGGGRIAVYYQNGGLTRPYNSEVQGGYGYGGRYGQRGTLVMINQQGTPGDTSDDHMFVYRNFRFENGDGPFRYASLDVYGSATIVGPMKPSEVMEFTTVRLRGSSDWYHPEQALSLTARDLTIDGSARIRGNSTTLTLTGNLRMEGGSYIDGSDVNVRGSSTALLNSSARIGANRISWVGTNLTLSSSSGVLDVSGRGHAQNTGSGAGFSNGSAYCSGSGASHGGRGRAGYCTGNIRNYYGSGLQPTTAGSGGGSSWCATGGRGGGTIRMELTGTLNNVGNFYSNGGGGSNSSCHGWRGAGGGAGGSIWVKTNSLAGSGRFTANGGRGGGGHGSYQGGGGGGGRVAVHYEQGGMSSPTRSTVNGGSGYGTAGVGTLVFVDNGRTPNDRRDDRYYAYQGFRFESVDAPYRVRSFRAHNSTAVSGPDVAGMPLEFSDRFELLPSATWRPNLHNTALSAVHYAQGSSSNTHAGTKTLTLTVSGTMTVGQTSYIDARTLNVRGTSLAEFISTGRVAADAVDWQGRSLTLSSSSNFNVSARGHVQNAGPSPGVANGRAYCSASGGSHGGRGRAGYCTSTTRPESGTARTPTLPGSGGGSSWCAAGGRGGGTIRVSLSDTLAVNGYFYADGGNGANSSCHGWRGSGGGAGGSIWVTTNTLAGSGRFQALGGAGGGGHNSYRGGGGGGGRIYIDYARTSSFSNPRLSSVRGGYGFGGAYSDSGTLGFFNRATNSLQTVEGWRWQANDGAHSFRNLTITDSTRDTSAQIRDDGSATTVAVSETLSMDSNAGWAFGADTTLNLGSLNMASSSRLTGSRSLTINVADSASLSSSTISATALRLTGDGDWTLGSSSRLTSTDIFLDDIGSVTLNSGANMLGNVRGTVANMSLAFSSAYINADGYGHGRDTGPGAGYSNGSAYCSGSGGSHGGRGNRGHCTGNTRAYYDKSSLPTEKGSGGGSSWGANGGSGGGVINLVVRGTLRNTGYMTASGARGANSRHHGWRGAGGGGGGSIKVDTNALTGTGYFRALGGDGGGGHNSYRGGGGGGGRIAVYYNTWAFSNPQNSTVLGGSGYAGRAEVGTLAFIDRGVDEDSTVDDNYHAFQGWRWQENDGAHRHRSFDAHNSSLVRGPDSNDQELTFTDTYRLKGSAQWVPNTHDSLLTARNLILDSSARIHASARHLRLALSGTGNQGSSAYINAQQLTVTGTSDYTLGSNAYVSTANLQWVGRNLTLGSSSSRFDTSGRGLGQNAGDGKGVSNGRAYCSGSGGGHGGRGGSGYCTGGVGAYYGSAKEPVGYGSGGGSSWCAAGGAGGGIIDVELSGQLHLTGYMYSNGGNGANSSCHGWRGAGGGAGGTIRVSTGRIRGAGNFRALGGNGGGGHNSYRGGGGGGGRIFVDYTDSAGFTNPRYSSVRGGYGFGGRYADNGTLAFYERDVRDLWVVEGWRWQQNDSPHTYNNLKITDSIHDSSAWVRDDGNAVRIDVTLLTSMDAASYWQTTAGLTDLRTTNLEMTNGRISGQPVSVTVGGQATLGSTSQVDTTSIRAGGVGHWTFNSSRFISPNIVFDQVGTVTLNSGSYLKGNVSGTMRNLSLTSTAASINATGYGYARDSGPGAGYANHGAYNSGSGGSHGGRGRGGYKTSSTRGFYGDLMNPVTKGSGGGSSWGANAGAGGGVVNLTVIDAFRNSGYIYADGSNGAGSRHHGWRGAGGGGGGSVNIDAGSYSGTGYVYARGGGGGGGHSSYRGGGGGGGRIFIRYNEITHTRRHQLYPTGGLGYPSTYGEVGTAALYDKVNDSLATYGGWRWEQASRPYHFKGFSAYNSTLVTTEGSAMDVQVDGDCVLNSSAQWNSANTDLSLDCFNLRMESASRLDAVNKTLTVTATGTVVLNGSAYVRGRTLSVLGAADISLNSSARFLGNMNVQGASLTLAAGAQLNAQGYGHGQNSGAGKGRSNGSAYTSGSGAGHGGVGLNGYRTGGPGGRYGNQERPVEVGSGGGSSWCAGAGAGGGSIHVVMIDRLQIDGQVYAHGNNGANSSCHGWRGAGGGSGGSILVEAGTFAGRGRLYARGGNGGGGHNSYRGGSGGGGRIATCVNQGGFIGARDVNGGYGYGGRYAQAGSVYDQCSPVLPEAAVVVSRGARSPGAGQHAPSTQGVIVGQYRLREVTRRKAVVVRRLNIKATGSLNDLTHTTGVKLFLDANGNGALEEGETLLGSGAYTANDGTISFTGLSLNIGAGAAVHLLVTYDLADTIGNGLTFAAQIERPDSVEIYTQDTNAEVPLYGAPSGSATQRIYQTPPPIVSYVSPSTVWQGADSQITLYGAYFTGATRVDVSDSNATQLAILSVYRSGTRMTVRVPSNVGLGRHHVRVTTPHGRNTASSVLLTVQASCNTGLHGICAAGITQGQSCVPRIEPGQRAEVCSNGVDEDCNGADLDCRDVDGDGDGFTPAEGDCNDNNSDIYPRDGLGCSGGRDDLDVRGVARAVVTYTPLADGGDQSWTSDVGKSWYQAAAGTIVNSSAHFPTATDYARVPNSIYLQPSGDKMSIGSWVKMDTVPDSGRYAVYAKGPQGAETFLLYWDGVHQCWVAVIQTVTGRYQVQARRTWGNGQWVHMGISYDGSQLRLHENGVVIASGGASGNILHNEGAIHLGGNIPGYTGMAGGYVDEFTFFGRAVTAQQWLAAVGSNRAHKRHAWGNTGPVIRFSYDFGPIEHNRRISGCTFHGRCRITGRSSQPEFPTFCSVVGTSTGFDIWDEPSGELWARYFGPSVISGGGVRLSSVDYVAAAGGRIYLGSHTNGGGGLVVLDYVADKVEQWTTDGVRVYNGGVGAMNVPAGYGNIDGNGLRIPNNIIRRLRGWTRQSTPYIGVACDEGVWVIEGRDAPYLSAGYLPRFDQRNGPAREQYALLNGCGVHPAGDRFYFGMTNRDHTDWDIITGTSYRYEGVDVNTPIGDLAQTMAPTTAPIVYGRRDGNTTFGSTVKQVVNWGGVRDVVIMPNASRHPDADGDDHIICMATDEGVVLLDQADSSGQNTDFSMMTLKSGEGQDTDTVKYVLAGGSDDAMALGVRGGELYVGTNGGGVSRLSLSDEGDFSQIEFYNTDTEIALPSNNVTALSCGKNALVATDEGVASIRYPDPGPCTVEGAVGACAAGTRLLVNNALRCVQTVQPTGEACDDVDNDCDGSTDEHPREGSICDAQDPAFEPLESVSVTTRDCNGAEVLLPTPLVSDGQDTPDELVVVNNAPSRFNFGRTTVLWQATDTDDNRTTAAQLVTVAYDGQPTLNVPEDVTKSAESPNGTAVELGQATGSICVPGGVTFTHDGPDRYPVGTTVVTWTARGQQGRPTTGTQRVIITDNVPPTIEVGADRTFDFEGNVRLPTPAVSDNASPVNRITVTHNAPNSYPIQEWVTITFTARDEAGNTATDSMRIFVQSRDTPPPTLTITSPTEAWHKPPVNMTAVVVDEDCRIAPEVTVNSQDLTFQVVEGNPGVFNVTSNRVSDGLHRLTTTATSGCSNKASNATRTFGVDSGGQTVLYSGISQDGVDPGDSSTWPGYSNRGLISLQTLVRDDLSGLASVTALIVNEDTDEEIELHSQTFDQRNGVPETGPRSAAVSLCSDEDYCTDGKLRFEALDGAAFSFHVVVTDVAGNTLAQRYFFKSLNLREAIIAWAEAVGGYQSESDQATALLTRIEDLLGRAVAGYDADRFGNTWLALEDAFALVIEARVYDGDVPFQHEALLVARLAADFQQAEIDTDIREHGDDDNFAEATRFVGLSRQHEEGNAPGDAFLGLANSYFWQQVGVDPMLVPQDPGPVAYRQANEVLGRILADMNAYAEVDPALGGRVDLLAVIELLDEVQIYFDDVVSEGDLSQSDLRHVTMLLHLTNTAERLKAAENQTAWVRNWQWGLTQITALYAYRALINAETWIGRNNPIWVQAQARFTAAEAYRLNKRADDYMSLLINSRCLLIGVYNGIYDPDVAVPDSCCAEIRQLNAVESRVPLPDQCLAPVVVTLGQGGFEPETIHVKVGQVVRWVNDTDTTQSVIGGLPDTPRRDLLESPNMAPNAVFTHEFDRAGTLPYFSAQSPSLRATVVVSE